MIDEVTWMGHPSPHDMLLRNILSWVLENVKATQLSSGMIARGCLLLLKRYPPPLAKPAQCAQVQEQ